MKSLQVAMLVLIIALAITLEYTYTSLSGENQQLASALNSLNQSYYQLNTNLTNISNELNSLKSLLITGTTPANATLGLSFSMALNTTVLHSGEAISVTLDEWNTLDSFNNVTASYNWAYSGFQQSGPCNPGLGLPNLPFTVSIVPGYYSASNLSGASSLPIFYPPSSTPIYCFSEEQPSEYDFYPASGNAVVHTFALLNESIATTLSFSGYYNSSDLPPAFQPLVNSTTQIGVVQLNETQPIAQVISFSPGVYTIIGGDEWGQLAVLHFIVL